MACSLFGFVGSVFHLECKRAVIVTGPDVLPLMIQTAREGEQGSKHKAKTRPTSATPHISRPDMSASASHTDAPLHPNHQASFAAGHVTNTAHVV